MFIGHNSRFWDFTTFVAVAKTHFSSSEVSIEYAVRFPTEIFENES